MIAHIHPQSTIHHLLTTRQTLTTHRPFPTRRTPRVVDEVAVSETVWPALAELFKDEKEDSGILCLLPDFKGDAATYLDQEVVEPLSQMGIGDRLETCVYAKKDGAPHNSFRIIVSPSAVPADAPNKSDDKDTMSAADAADEEAGRSGEGKVI